MTHGAITVIFCTLLFFLKLSATLFFLPAAFYLGREITQAEYRYIEKYCDHKRKNMPWYAIFLPKAWTVKGIFDWLIPLIISSAFYLASILFFL